jgi:hypothetical protein
MKKLPSLSSRIVLSIVSHGQIPLIVSLLADLQKLDLRDTSIALTINVPEDLFPLQQFESLPIALIENERPKGFGENHNSAFALTECEFFAVVNPDIRLEAYDLTALVAPFECTDVGAVAPVVLSPAGEVEDSVRHFPTLMSLFRRTVLRERAPNYIWGGAPIDVDWAAGMFVVYRSIAFSKIQGFDARYFMYMEDADICLRLKKAGWRTVLQPACTVVHDARRASRRSFRHLRWHLASAFRFLFLPTR